MFVMRCRARFSGFCSLETAISYMQIIMNDKARFPNLRPLGLVVAQRLSDLLATALPWSSRVPI